MNYDEFLLTKQKKIVESGFDISENKLNPMLFDFQKFTVRRALKSGKTIFSDFKWKLLEELNEWINCPEDPHESADIILVILAFCNHYNIDIQKALEEKNATIFKCEFCGKIYQREYFAQRHEKFCNKNPKNIHPCWDCKFLKRENVVHEGTYYDYKVLTFFCMAKDELELHSFGAEKSRVMDFLNSERMPTKCDLFKHDGE